MTSKELAEVERLARVTRPKIGSALYGQILALTAYVRHLEAIREAVIGLMSDGGNQYIDRLHKLLNERKAGG